MLEAAFEQCTVYDIGSTFGSFDGGRCSGPWSSNATLYILGSLFFAPLVCILLSPTKEHYLTISLHEIHAVTVSLKVLLQVVIVTKLNTSSSSERKMMEILSNVQSCWLKDPNHQKGLVVTGKCIQRTSRCELFNSLVWLLNWISTVPR
jgi:hypothetical protein